jgi:putative ABC transport system substrate-binding protein
VGSGLVTSLARPGGNITGLSTQHHDSAGKRVELLREVVRPLRRLSIMVNPGNSGDVLETRAVEAAAFTFALKITTLAVRRAEDIPPAIDTVKGEVDALYVAADALFFTNRNRLNALALSARLPTMHGSPGIVPAGGLMSYAPSYVTLFQRTADYVDKILRGLKAADLPVEQPTKFELLINLKTAKALGLTIPPSVLLRADHVIE